MELIQRVTELERRLANVFLLGTIIDADYDKALVKVECGELETSWLNWITRRAGNDADWWAPEIGEQVVVMSQNGDIEMGVVLPAIYQDRFPATDKEATVRRVQFADGADFSYDRRSHTLNIVLPDSATATIVSDGGFEITGDTKINGQLHVTKNIKSDKDISDKTRSMQADRGIYNGHDHPAGSPIVGKVIQKQ